MTSTFSELFFIAFFFSISIFLQINTKLPLLVVSKQDSSIIFDQNLIRITSLGNKIMFADLIWVQTLLESDLDHYSKNDLNSWLYLRFNSIIQLDPLFYQVYYFGGQYLMVVKNDLKGAENLLLRAIEKYPDDYSLNYSLGFLYAIELGDQQKAYAPLIKIQNSPHAPKNIKSFIGKIINATFGAEDAFEYTMQAYRQEPDNTIIKIKLKDNLYSLKAQIDLECLNANKENCSIRDFDGVEYIKKNGKFTATKKWKPALLTTKQSSH